MDSSHGYEEHAEAFLRARNERIGPDLVRKWSEGFKPGSAILELGCGHGVISAVLPLSRISLYAIDASPTLLNIFRKRFPEAVTECADAETSKFFDRTFDGILAWGLVFLLSEEGQRSLLRKAAGALNPGGRLLFTAPHEAVTWNDGMTGQESVSLGAKAYQELLASSGLLVEEGAADCGENYYYRARKALQPEAP